MADRALCMCFDRYPAVEEARGSCVPYDELKGVIVVDDLGQWLKSLQKKSSGEGMTVREIAEQSGHSEDWVRSKLQQAKSQGLLIVSMGFRESLSGKKVQVPLYSFKKEGK